MGGLGSSGSCGKTLREGEIRWLQDQTSGEDKHEEQLCERTKPVVLGEGRILLEEELEKSHH